MATFKGLLLENPSNHMHSDMAFDAVDVHTPLVDDMGIDAIVRKEDGSFIEAQIKARSKNVIEIQRALVYGHRESWGDAYHFHQFPVRNVSSKSRYGVRACGQPFSWFGRYGNAISPTSMEAGIAHCWGCIGNCECRNEGLNSRKSDNFFPGSLHPDCIIPFLRHAL